MDPPTVLRLISPVTRDIDWLGHEGGHVKQMGHGQAISLLAKVREHSIWPITTSPLGARGVMGRCKAKERVFPSSPFPSTPVPVARVTRRRLGMSHTLHILCYKSNSCFTLSTDNGSALMHYFTLMIRRRYASWSFCKGIWTEATIFYLFIYFLLSVSIPSV